jgi:hypothetical protein
MALKPTKWAVPASLTRHEADTPYGRSERKGTKRRDTLGRGLENAPRGRAGLSSRDIDARAPGGAGLENMHLTQNL